MNRLVSDEIKTVSKIADNLLFSDQQKRINLIFIAISWLLRTLYFLSVDGDEKLLFVELQQVRCLIFGQFLLYACSLYLLDHTFCHILKGTHLVRSLEM